MLKISKILLLIISVALIAFSGCNTGQKKEKSDNNDQGTVQEISAEFQEKQKELKQFIGGEFSKINDKIRELNGKIEEGEKKLTEEHNEMLDEIQERRIAANEKLNNLKDVSEEEWEEFQQKLKKDIDEIKSRLDKILEDFN